MRKYYTACRETGDLIDCFSSYKEAQKAIEQYEEEDKRNGDYTEDFYDIEDEGHFTLRPDGTRLGD